MWPSRRYASPARRGRPPESRRAGPPWLTNMRAALGEKSSDERSVAVVASVIGPPTFFALRGRGLSSDEAVGMSLELALSWLEQRRDAPAGLS